MTLARASRYGRCSAGHLGNGASRVAASGLGRAWKTFVTGMDSHRRIIADDQHIALLDGSNGKTVWLVEWAEVMEVAAWKHDVFTYDIICLGLPAKGETEYNRCDEEDDGWRDLLLAMERTLGVRSSDWRERVAVPAFQKDWTILWKLPSG